MVEAAVAPLTKMYESARNVRPAPFERAQGNAALHGLPSKIVEPVHRSRMNSKGQHVLMLEGVMSGPKAPIGNLTSERDGDSHRVWVRPGPEVVVQSVG